ncbi:MAG TPA: hypothetical protein VFH78_10335, partial [Candidatus Thermoplasmatota archaeon]|nr:hypothetical protein [Candidatus Thermoplasmatota archaeon]
LLSTIDVVGSALRAMGIPITDVSKHSDAFALVARKTTVDVADFSTAIAANAREMKSMGKTVEDAAAAVLGLHARGMGGAEAVKTLTEAIQDGAVFSELWTERLGLSGQTIDILRARIGETNRETLIYAESVSNASDRIESLKKLVGEALAPALWEAIKSMEAGDVAAKTLGGGLGVAYTAAQKLFDGIGSMKEVPQAFAGFSDDVVRRLNEIALAADAAWAAVRRLHSEQGGKVGSATDLGTGVTSPIYAPPRPPDKPGLPPPTTSAAILPPVVNMPAAPRDAHAAYTSAAIANYLNGGVVKGFSSGGIVRDDGLAMLHGPEAVLPLDRLTPMMAEALAAAMSGWSGGGARGVDATTGAPSGGTTIVIHNLHLQDIRGLEQALRARGYVG